MKMNKWHSWISNPKFTVIFFWPLSTTEAPYLWVLDLVWWPKNLNVQLNNSLWLNEQLIRTQMMKRETSYTLFLHTPLCSILVHFSGICPLHIGEMVATAPKPYIISEISRGEKVSCLLPPTFPSQCLIVLRAHLPPGPLKRVECSD